MTTVAAATTEASYGQNEQKIHYSVRQRWHPMIKLHTLAEYAENNDLLTEFSLNFQFDRRWGVERDEHTKFYTLPLSVSLSLHNNN